LRAAFASRGLSNAFAEREPTLLIPAIDLNTAERVVFGAGNLRDVPISQAVAASSAIPGFFDPYPINGRDYVDGGTGFSGHADLGLRGQPRGAALRLCVDEGVAGRAGRTARAPYAVRGRLAGLPLRLGGAAREGAEAVVSRVLVGVAERRVVEDRVDERVDRP